MADFFTKTHEKYPDPVTRDKIEFKGKIKSVSYSGMSTYEQCEYALYLNKVKSIEGIGSPAMDRGSLMHNALERYVNGKDEELNWSMFKAKYSHQDIIETFRDEYLTGLCIPELKLAFNKNMKPVHWVASNMWLRGAIDIVLWHDETKKQCSLYDYKSGSNQSGAKHRSQLMLYALMMFITYPELEFIRTAPIYLDHKVAIFYTDFRRSDLDLLWPRYLQRLQAVTKARTFTPNPNGFTCRFCQHKKAQEALNQTEPACEFAYIG